MVTTRQLFLAPCSDVLALGHLHRLLRHGVSAETVSAHTDYDGDGPVSVWGVDDGNRSNWEHVREGDYVLFHTGNGSYEYAAEVRGTEHDPELAAEIWADSDAAWEYLVFFEDPIEVEIDDAEVSEYGDLFRPQPLGFSKLPERGVERLVDDFGGVEAYVTARARAERTPDDESADERTETSEPEPMPADSFEYRERFPAIARQLRAAKQVIFHGPPGTGKTYTARNFARWWITEQSDSPTESQLRLVTFHPSFTYEDFLEGLTAERDAEGTGVSYEIKDGIFKQICADASAAAEEARAEGRDPPPYVLIIDEINRGNLAQIFGETITLLEKDKREAVSGDLAHSSDRFTVPSNLYIIGTMNTADRSIALVDAALRRRFRFVSFPPEYDTLVRQFDLGSVEEAEATAEAEPDTLAGLQSLSVLALKHLNDRIIALPDLGKGKQIGHSYLLLEDPEDPQELHDAWRYEILPLLEEYFFGQIDRLQRDILGDAGDVLVDSDSREIRDFSLDELREALRSLVGTEGTADAQAVAQNRT